MQQSQRLNLEQMINENDAEDNTAKIKKLKHSKLIKQDIETYKKISKKYRRMKNDNKKMYSQLMIRHCNFLWTNYTNIFNRLIKEELDLTILAKFIHNLELVEDGKQNQYEASVKVGELLKELYIDSAVKRQEKVDERNDKLSEKDKTIKPKKTISWVDYKAQIKN
jgi:hypothetical protein